MGNISKFIGSLVWLFDGVILIYLISEEAFTGLGLEAGISLLSIPISIFVFGLILFVIGKTQQQTEEIQCELQQMKQMLNGFLSNEKEEN